MTVGAASSGARVIGVLLPNVNSPYINRDPGRRQLPGPSPANLLSLDWADARLWRSHRQRAPLPWRAKQRAPPLLHAGPSQIAGEGEPSVKRDPKRIVGVQ